jgi:Spy/CpxP family protein refolding chaperone
MQNLFPPPMVMQAGEEIGLTEDQRNAMRTEMEKSRDQFEPAQQKLREQMEILGNLLKEPRVNEAQVTAQLGQVLAAENEIKKMQIAQLVRIKNLLTPEQQEKLRNYMKDHRPPMPPEGQRGERPPFGREREGERGGERRRPPPPQNE